MIIRGSRYENATVARVQTANQGLQFAVYPGRESLEEPVTFVYRTVHAGDRFDLLANAYYGNPLLWWVLARANPEIIYPDELPVGALVRIPSASTGR